MYHLIINQNLRFIKMALEFKCGGQVYQHCKKLDHPDDHTLDYELVVALVEGKHDWWVIDDPFGFAEIQHYYVAAGINYIYHMFKYQQTHQVIINS